MRTEFLVVKILLGTAIAAQSVEPCGARAPLPEDKKIPATYCRRELMSDSFLFSEPIVYAGPDQAEPVAV